MVVHTLNEAMLPTAGRSLRLFTQLSGSHVYLPQFMDAHRRLVTSESVLKDFTIQSKSSNQNIRGHISSPNPSFSSRGNVDGAL